MSTETHPILRQLFHDHGNMLRILAVFELEIDRHRRGGGVNVELIKLILEYALTYPDLRHHPREDRLLERMLMKNPLAAAGPLDLLLEHARLAELSRRLAAAFHNLVRDKSVSLEDFDDLAGKFISDLRKHMSNEEAFFFPVAVQTLRSEDWYRLNDEGLPAAGLATVGDRIDLDYQGLHDRIMAQAA